MKWKPDFDGVFFCSISLLSLAKKSDTKSFWVLKKSVRSAWKQIDKKLLICLFSNRAQCYQTYVTTCIMLLGADLGAKLSQVIIVYMPK